LSVYMGVIVGDNEAMRTYLDCYPCFLRQALEAARQLGADQYKQKIVLERVLELLGSVELSRTPPEIGDRVHRLIRRELGDGDPYRSFKEKATREALAVYPRIKSLFEGSDNPLETAVRLSIAGNIIDAGANTTYQLWPTVQRVLSQPFAIDDMEVLRRTLSGITRVLFLADNAGETVFDRPLIEALEVPVVYAVKGSPILNDATIEDARMAGIDQIAQLLSTGSDAPGTILERCSKHFQQVFEESELVIAKGQANYETLSERGSKVFCLLQAKCPVIARDLQQVPVGSIVLRRGAPRSTFRPTGEESTNRKPS
jgi:uncharacterized protein with ATP-grasp and redox domains